MKMQFCNSSVSLRLLSSAIIIRVRTSVSGLPGFLRLSSVISFKNALNSETAVLPSESCFSVGDGSNAPRIDNDQFLKGPLKE